MKKTILTTLLSCLLSVASFSQSGFIDSTFGIHGRVNTDFKHRDYTLCITPLADSSILLGGTSNINNYVSIFEECIWVKYKYNGTIDSSFAVNGELSIDSNYFVARNMIELPNGKLLLLCDKAVNPNGVCVIRLNANGTTDNTFGQNGWAQPRFSAAADYAWDMAVQPDGKILVSSAYAITTFPLVTQASVFRLLPNGTVDSSFGINGMTKNTVLSNLPGYAYDLYLRPNGKILIAGEAYESFSEQHTPFAFQYLSNGKLDSSFASYGKYIKNLSLTASQYNNTVLGLHGELTFAASYTNANNRYLELICLDSTGHINTSFANNGNLVYNLGDNYSSFSEASRSRGTADGKVITALFADFGGKVMLVRTNNGFIDSTFGIGGKITDSCNTLPFMDMCIQNENKIVISGSYSPTGSCCDENIAMFRFGNFNNSVSTGVSEFAIGISQFSIYPNPASNSVTITVDETLLGSTLTVYDITGKKMTAVQLISASQKLNITNFSNGVYFVTIENEKGRTTKKFIIQK